MKIIFLRHGESMANLNTKFYVDDATNFLSLRGVLQAQLAAHTIREILPSSDPFDATFVSDMTRSGQTACVVLQTLMDTRDHIQRDERLNEWCYESDGTLDDLWYTLEDEDVFWNRIESFYDEKIKPVMDTDVTYFIASHYYTMKGLFDVLGQRTGLINSYTPLNPHNGGGIPNAIPYYYDSKVHSEPQIMLPDHNVKSR